MDRSAANGTSSPSAGDTPQNRHEDESDDEYHSIPEYPSAAAQMLVDEDDDDEDEDDPDYRDEAFGDFDEDDDDDEDAAFHETFTLEVTSDLDEDEADDDGDNDMNEGDGGGVADITQEIIGLIRGRGRGGLLTRAQLFALLRSHNMNHVILQEDDDDEDDPDWGNYFGRRRRARRQPKDPNRFPKVPSPEGMKLMRLGQFGATDDRRFRKQRVRRALERELGVGTPLETKRNNDLLTQSMVPGTKAEQIIHYDDPIYSGQFSDDGNFFFSCCQDFKIRMYDTSNPYNWKHYKTAAYPFGQWTLTDASLSPNNRWLAYTSINNLVSIAPTDPNDIGDPYTLDLSSDNSQYTGWGRGRGGFGIFSVRFSGDGRELVAGTNSNAIVIYDIESRRVLHHIIGHRDDVNAVCFADKASPHIIYSGSDDATIKVWDRRSMGDGREAGAFLGHTEGLTYIDSKGDGRYILSNGKDQSMKLWDLRMAMSTDRFHEIDESYRLPDNGFDYRGNLYDEEDWDPHPHDNSLVTFRGHKVLRTLIRCHFSPPNSTNSRYVYSGSADGKVFIYNMDATQAGVIDVKKATMGTRQVDRHSRLWFDEEGGWGTCVRDASWHPNAPVLVASALNGYNMSRGTCTLHSFNENDEDEGEPNQGRSVDHMLKADPSVYFDSVYGI